MRMGVLPPLPRCCRNTLISGADQAGKILQAGCIGLIGRHKGDHIMRLVHGLPYNKHIYVIFLNSPFNLGSLMQALYNFS